ncbi:MAG: 50S ribosomal protein L29 [Proteobacteria bacterium]|nr:50S ribosomal protein L29 [Pseudomonadota bacterium]
MRAKEIRERKDDELLRMLEDAQNQLFRYRLQNATHQLDNTSIVQTTRREIARINTVITERSITSGPNSAPIENEEE